MAVAALFYGLARAVHKLSSREAEFTEQQGKLSCAQGETTCFKLWRSPKCQSELNRQNSNPNVYTRNFDMHIFCCIYIYLILYIHTDIIISLSVYLSNLI